MIQLHNVSYSYTGQNIRIDAIRQISYAFEKGRFYALMGPSGSGKSTLMQLMNALIRPSEGEILFQGQSIQAMNPNGYRLKHISMIHQNFCLLPFMTILENVMYPARLMKIPGKEAKKRAMAQLSALGLEESYHRRLPAMLSGGEQQRVAIARALCTGAQVLTADEPTGNLDTENARRIGDIFIRLAHEEQKTIIMVTHDPEMAHQADIILQLRDGKIINEKS